MAKKLSELIDKDGTKIKGDEPLNPGATSSLTTDDAIKMNRQTDMPKFLYRGFYGEDDETNVDAKIPKKKSKKKSKKSKKNIKKSLKKESRDRMKGVIENIFTKKDFDRDIVDNFKYSDIKLNGIPGLETISDTNPILIRKAAILKDIIEKNDATGEEKAIIINHMLGMDMTDIPQVYKSELKKKIR
jgi:hypothetical protein